MNTNTAFDTHAYQQQLTRFPDITYEAYEKITNRMIREDIARKNKLVKTDAYNRTMMYIKGLEGSLQEETHTLSFRRSPNNQYNVVYGIRNRLKELFSSPYTMQELDFAEQFYAAQEKKGGVSYFNRKIYQDIIEKHDGRLPITIDAVADGTVLRPHEPVMRIHGPSELAALYEPLLLRIFYESCVATDAHEIEEILGSGRVVEFGNRSAINDNMHIAGAEACYVGGGIVGTSNDLAATVIPQLKTSGTIAHRFLSAYPTEDEAFAQACEKTDKIALLIDLADSYSGIDKALALKKKYRGEKQLSMRLDSGDMIDQAIYALKQQQALGFTDPSQDYIIFSDISDIEHIRTVEQKIQQAGFDPKKWIYYGMGGLLIARNKTRGTVSAAMKLTYATYGPTGKLSNDAGKEPIPGRPNIELRDGVRMIVQEDEPQLAPRLLQTVYDKGTLHYDDDDIAAIDTARQQLLATLAYKDHPTQESTTTARIHQQVRENISTNTIDTTTVGEWTTEQDIIHGLKLDYTAASQEQYASQDAWYSGENNDISFPLAYLFYKLSLASNSTLQAFINYPHQITCGTTHGGHGSAAALVSSKKLVTIFTTEYPQAKNLLSRVKQLQYI